MPNELLVKWFSKLDQISTCSVLYCTESADNSWVAVSTLLTSASSWMWNSNKIGSWGSVCRVQIVFATHIYIFIHMVWITSECSKGSKNRYNTFLSNVDPYRGCFCCDIKHEHHANSWFSFTVNWKTCFLYRQSDDIHATQTLIVRLSVSYLCARGSRESDNSTTTSSDWF